jgi:hypothetical protein
VEFSGNYLGMKLFFLFLFVLIAYYSNGREKTYVGSTPAGDVVRTFLGIPLSDSVDFVRWWITITDKTYSLKCNYGVGKPNTPGFWNGGKWIELNGSVTEKDNYYSFQNKDRVLKMLELNPGLLHLADEHKNLLVGTGGFSYALNNNKTPATSQVTTISKQELLKDSMAYVGRTPCSDFSINRPGSNCIKMKWSIVFYTNLANHTPTIYLLNRSRVDVGKKGTWKIVKGKDGRVIYELTPENETIPTYLLKLDDNILLFTDAKGNLLIGNEDFSFTLNRKR